MPASQGATPLPRQASLDGLFQPGLVEGGPDRRSGAEQVAVADRRHLLEEQPFQQRRVDALYPPGDILGLQESVDEGVG